MKKNGLRVSLLITMFAGFIFNAASQKTNALNSLNDGSDWFAYFDFNALHFKNPAREFGPFTRWWWPGNDVTNEELRRETRMFADNGFAGVEIQPLTMGINPNAPAEQLNRVYSWDTPSFYDHVRAVMEQAGKSGISVDLNGGSGWPIGGPQVKPQESMLTLTYADTIVTGGQTISIHVPANYPTIPASLYLIRFIFTKPLILPWQNCRR
jgi:hypothetical protein